MIGVLIEMPEPGWWIWCWGNLNPSELITLIGLRVSYFLVSIKITMVHGTILGLGHLAQLLSGKNESKRLFGTHLQLILERKKIVSHLGTLREATKICFPGKQTKMWKIHVSLLIFIYHIYIYTHELHIHRLYASITYIFTYLHIYTYTYWHIYIYTYIHIYIYTYIHIYTCIHVYIYTYIHIYIHTYIHMFVYVHVYSCIHIYINTYMHIYIYTYVHICTYINIYLHKYTYCIYIHISIYIYIHIYKYRNIKHD